MKILFLALALISFNCFGRAFTENVQQDFTVGNSSTLLLPANMQRKYLIIVNNGPEHVVIKLGNPHNASEGIKIISGGNWEPLNPPNARVYAKSLSGTSSTVYVLEGR